MSTRALRIAEVIDLHHRYFNALDAGNWDALGRCFAPDATATYLSGRSVLRGRDEIVRGLSRVREFQPSVHVLANCGVEGVVGEVFALAYLNVAAPGASCVVTRGLRYTDTFVHSGAAIQFHSRLQMELWQTQAPSVPPGLPDLPPIELESSVQRPDED